EKLEIQEFKYGYFQQIKFKNNFNQIKFKNMKFSDLNALKLILKIKKISINKIIHSSTAAGGVVYLGTSTGEIIEIVSDRLIIKKIHDDSITDIKVFRCADLNGEECVDALRGRNKIDLKNRKKKEIHFYATASQDSTIKIWENGNLIQTLKGHLDRVNEILWIDDFKDNNCNPSLISVSNDNTVIIWAYTFGKWSINQRLGGIMEKNKAFLGVYNERDCLWVLGLTGFYKYVVDSKSMKYKLVEGISGHQSPVMDLDWKNGVLMSCGKDMTVRLFERRYFNNNVKKDFKKDHDNFKDDHKEGINFKDFKKGCDNSEDFKKGCDNSEDFKKGCDDFKDENEEINFTGDYDSANEIAEENQFHEISRPVIHGYPVFSSKFFMDGIVIGSDEPVLRIFKPSEYFLKLNCHSAIARSEGINISSIDSKKNNTNFNSSPSDQPIEYVTNSELSLTNEIHCDILDEPLNEKSLSDFLLFKETKKLYGHYFSVRSVVVKNNLVFSVNKSRCRSYSQIYVWKSSIFADRKGNGEKKRDEGNNNNHCADDFNDADIKLIQKVEIHDLEITRLRIKKNFLVACSRDRTFSIYRINSDYKKSSINSDYKKSTNNSDSDYKKS
ncbi:Elongator complex protein 2, partial [Dictyocoela roeselum]